MASNNTELMVKIMASLEEGNQEQAFTLLKDLLEEELDPTIVRLYFELCLDLAHFEEIEDFVDNQGEIWFENPLNQELVPYYFQSLLNQKKYLYLLEEVDWEKYSDYQLIKEQADNLLRLQEIEIVQAIKEQLNNLEQQVDINPEAAMYLVQRCLNLRWDKRQLILPLLLQAEHIPSIAKTQLLQDWYLFSEEETILIKWHGKDRKIYEKALYLLQRHIFWLEGEDKIRALMEDKDVSLTEMLVQYFYSDLLSLYPFIDEHIDSIEEWLELTLVALEANLFLAPSDDEVLERLPKLLKETH